LVQGRLFSPISQPSLTSTRWAGFVLSRELDKRKFQTIVVSPRSYFVFTPLLASTAVGTLEFRTTLESVRARRTEVQFIQGWGNDVNFDEKRIQIEESPMQITLSSPSRGNATDAAATAEDAQKGKLFDLEYDKLVVAVGCYTQTFNTPGVRENALFLKDVSDARKIRKRIIDCELCRSSSRSILIVKASRLLLCQQLPIP
jgi:NADH dehydrogenase FAD-containing subunit